VEFINTLLSVKDRVLAAIGTRGGVRWCATSREIEVSISDGVNGIFHWFNPSGRTMTLPIVLKSVTSWNPKDLYKPV